MGYNHLQPLQNPHLELPSALRVSCAVPHKRQVFPWFPPGSHYFPCYVNCQHVTSFSRRRQWHPTPALLPGKSHGQRRLVGCSPWGREESNTTDRLHFHFSLSCIGEGNGNPLQCSCLESPRDGGAWWEAVYGVAQSRTRLKRLSSSSSSSSTTTTFYLFIKIEYEFLFCLEYN